MNLKSQILNTVEKELLKIWGSVQQEDLGCTNGIISIIDTIKDKLKVLFSELNNRELDTGIIHKNKFFFQQNFLRNFKNY